MDGVSTVAHRAHRNHRCVRRHRQSAPGHRHPAHHGVVERGARRVRASGRARLSRNGTRRCRGRIGRRSHRPPDRAARQHGDLRPRDARRVNRRDDCIARGAAHAHWIRAWWRDAERRRACGRVRPAASASHRGHGHDRLRPSRRHARRARRDSIAAVARLAGPVRPWRRCPCRGGNRAPMAAAGITSVSGPPPFEMDRALTDAAADGPSHRG